MKNREEVGRGNFHKKMPEKNAFVQKNTTFLRHKEKK